MAPGRRNPGSARPGEASSLVFRTRDRRLVGLERVVRDVCAVAAREGLAIRPDVAQEVVLAARRQVMRRQAPSGERLGREVRAELLGRGILLTEGQVHLVLRSYCQVLVEIDWVAITEIRSGPRGSG